MATITSVQTGPWYDPATWVGGVIPNPWIDDVVIASGHTVVILPYSYVSIADNHVLTVQGGGLLVIVGGLDVFYFAVLDVQGDLDIVAGAWLYVYDDGYPFPLLLADVRVHGACDRSGRTCAGFCEKTSQGATSPVMGPGYL